LIDKDEKEDIFLEVSFEDLNDKRFEKLVEKHGGKITKKGYLWLKIKFTHADQVRKFAKVLKNKKKMRYYGVEIYIDNTEVA